MKPIKLISFILILFMNASIFAQVSILSPQEDDYIYTFSIKNMEKINTSESNFGAAYYKENIVFASPKKSKIIKDTWLVNNQAFLDLMVARLDNDGSLTFKSTLKGKINTRYHEAIASFTKDYKEVYFTRNNYFDKKLAKDKSGKARLGLYHAIANKSGKWKHVKPLALNNANYSIGHPTLSKDGKTLYFISDMPGTLGETDIYKVRVLEDGTYGKPENLGSKINSSAKELFPFIDENNILYFSSDRKETLGGLDIFYVDLNNDAAVVNHFNTSINSKKDDFAFVKKEGEKKGYFSSNREGGEGDDDIYYHEFTIKEKPCKESNLIVQVLDSLTQERITKATIVITENEKEVHTDIMDSDSLNVVLTCNSDYSLIATKSGYNTKTIKFNSFKKQEIVVLLKPIPKEEYTTIDSGKAKDICSNYISEINTYRFLFDFDKADLRDEVKFKLDELIEILNICKNINLKIAGHTDERGSKAYNKRLSLRRSKAVRNYLIEKGNINASRLKSIGYGKERLLNKHANSKEAHQLNRRVEFSIQ